MPIKDQERLRRYRREYYYCNIESEFTRIKARVEELKAKLKEYKQGKSCEFCGENHPACLEFHHKDPSTKTLEVSKASRYGWAWKQVLEEIAKCIILCANCHRKWHAN